MGRSLADAVTRGGEAGRGGGMMRLVRVSCVFVSVVSGVKLYSNEVDPDVQRPMADAERPLAETGTLMDRHFEGDGDADYSQVGSEDEIETAWDPKDFEPRPEWMKLPQPVVPDMPIKLAVMMMAVGHVSNPSMWLGWLKQARTHGIDVKFLIHRTEEAGRQWSDDPEQQEFLPYLVKKLAPASWGRMTEAERRLMEEALEDETVTHLAVVSSDSIPIKPAAWIYKELEEQRESRFCTADHKIPPRAEMWWVMRREDALLFRDHKYYILGQKAFCADEKVWYYPLKRRMEALGPEVAGIQSQCIMFTDWKTGLKINHTWSEHIEQFNATFLREENQTGAANAHPNTYATLGPESMRELLDSPFWFARKFSRSALSNATVDAALSSWGFEGQGANESRPVRDSGFGTG